MEITKQLTREESSKRNRELHLELFQELQALNLAFHTELRGRIDSYSMELGIINSEEKSKDNIYYPDWNSSVTIYREDKNRVEMFNKPPFTLSYSSSSTITPNTSNGFWKTKHSCIILENWDKVMEVCVKYFNIQQDFEDNYEIV